MNNIICNVYRRTGAAVYYRRLPAPSPEPHVDNSSTNPRTVVGGFDMGHGEGHARSAVDEINPINGLMLSFGRVLNSFFFSPRKHKKKGSIIVLRLFDKQGLRDLQHLLVYFIFRLNPNRGCFVKIHVMLSTISNTKLS